MALRSGLQVHAIPRLLPVVAALAAALAPGPARPQPSPAAPRGATPPASETPEARLHRVQARLDDLVGRMLRARRGLLEVDEQVLVHAATGAPGDLAPLLPAGGEPPGRPEAPEAELQALEARLAAPAAADAPEETPLARAQRRHQLGMERFRDGDWLEAAALLQDAAETGAFKGTGDHVSALVTLGDALGRLGACGQAVAAHRQVLALPPSPAAAEGLVRGGRCLLDQGRHGEVVELAARVRRAWGDRDVPADLAYLAAKAAYRRTDLAAPARDRAALEALAAVPAPHHVAAAYLRGAAHLRAGETDRALAEFEACTRLAGDGARERDQRELCAMAAGRLHAHKGSFVEMEHWYALAPAASRHHAEGVYEQARTLERGGLLDDARRLLAPVPAPPPDSRLAAEVGLLRGTLLAREGREREAAAAYEEVRDRLDPVRVRLDAALAADRDPATWLARLAPGLVPGPPSELPALAVAWAREAGDAGPGRELLAALDATGASLGELRAASARADAALSREGGLVAFPRLAEARSRARDVGAAAARIEGAVAQDPSAAGASLRARAGDLQARAAREERALVERARAESDRYRVPLAEDQRALAGAGAELDQMRREAVEAAGRDAHRAFQVARARMASLLLRADREAAEAALARHAAARGQLRALIHRRAFEDRLALPDERRRAAAGAIDARGRTAEAEERAARQAAIARLEEFARRHPDDPGFTPLALARLGELRYERAEEEGAARGASAAAGGRSREPRGCAAALSTYQRLAEGFPGHRENDRVHFLIGYCLGEVGRAPEAIQVFEELLREHPGSPLAAEARVRLGDLLFDEGSPASLRRAVEAYRPLYGSPDHALYVHALYMLGWTWYRTDDLPRAIEAFTKLLDHFVETATRTGVQPRGDLWADALRYAAASLADPRWDGPRKAREWFEGHGRRIYEATLYQRLGDMLLDQGRYPSAVEAFEMAIARAPTGAEAPHLQAKVVRAWTLDRRPERAAAARDVLLTAYADGSPWAQRHAGSPELLKEVRALREGKLAEAAAYNQARAQALAKDGQVAAAVEAYQRAERAYASHLQSAADDPNAYDLTFAWADAAYGAGLYEKAARLFEQVRDDPVRTQHQAEAALEAVRAWEAEGTRLQKSGQLPERKLVLAKDRPGEAPGPEPFPAPVASWVRAADAFVERNPGHPRAAPIAYAAGETAYRYAQWDEARRRLEAVVARWPGSEVAGYAANLVIETHLARKDWASVEGASSRLRGQVAQQNAALARSLGELELGGRFQRALGLMEARRWAEAAPVFVSVADAAPAHEFADKALHNAARCLEEDGRPAEALPLLARIAERYPASPFADGALFRLAVRADERWDPDRAAERYELLLQRYPQSRYRRDAQYNLARALDQLERHEDAARAWARWSEAFPDDPDAPKALARAAALLERARDWTRAAQAWRELQRRLGKGGDAELAVQAPLRLGLAERQLGNEPAARAALAAAAAEFDRRGLDPARSPAAATAAAEARFLLAEVELERFDRIQLPATTNAARLRKALDEKLAEMRSVAPRYQEVKRYLRPEWTLAAFYRQAYLLEALAQTLYDAPVPPEFKRPGQEEYLAAYQDQLSAYARPYEDEAVQVYEQAAAAARELHVRNAWTRKTEEALARHRPREHRPVRELRGRWLDDAPAAAAAEAAEREARAALAADPRSVASLVRLAAALQARGRLELARSVLEQARQLDGASAAAWNRTAFVERALGRPASALEAWRRAAEAAPADAVAQANLGQALIETGDVAGATGALEKAVQAAPGTAAAWLDLGNARARAGRFADAQAAYERALAVDARLADAWLDLALLHLDVEAPGMPAEARLARAIEHLDRFAAEGGRDPSVDALRSEAQAALERERRRQARDAAGRSAAPAAATPAAGDVPAPAAPLPPAPPPGAAPPAPPAGPATRGDP